MTDAIEQLIGADPFDWWRAALAQPDRRLRPPADVNRPAQGYYRVKRKGVWTPVAFWYDGDELVCLLNIAEFLDNDRALQVWGWAYDHPISEETYNNVIAGGQWPDLDEAVAEHMATGHNKPPVDELEDFKIEIENAAAAVERYQIIQDDETSQKAQSARARLNELARKGDKRREELKAPHLAAGRKVDGDWMPLVKLAKGAADKIAQVMSGWENQKARAHREAEEAAQRAADRAIQAGVPPSAMESPPTVPAVPPPSTKIKGGYGRAATVQDENELDQVTDYAALAADFIEDQRVKSLILFCAKQAIRDGHQPHGCTIKKVRKVK